MAGAPLRLADGELSASVSALQKSSYLDGKLFSLEPATRAQWSPYLTPTAALRTEMPLVS